MDNRLIIDSQSLQIKSILDKNNISYIEQDVNLQLDISSELSAKDLVKSLALQKAKYLSTFYPDSNVLSSVNIVQIYDNLLQYPQNYNDLAQQLVIISGKHITVHIAYCFISGTSQEIITNAFIRKLQIKFLNDYQINEYVNKQYDRYKNFPALHIDKSFIEKEYDDNTDGKKSFNDSINKILSHYYHINVNKPEDHQKQEVQKKEIYNYHNTQQISGEDDRSQTNEKKEQRTSAYIYHDGQKEDSSQNKNQHDNRDDHGSKSRENGRASFNAVQSEKNKKLQKSKETKETIKNKETEKENDFDKESSLDRFVDTIESIMSLDILLLLIFAFIVGVILFGIMLGSFIDLSQFY